MAARTVYITGERGDVGSMLQAYLAERDCLAVPLDQGQPGRARRLLHLAAKSPPASPRELAASNLVYLRRCMEKALALGVEEVVFFSAMSVYGNPDQEGLGEHGPFTPPSLYGLSKLKGERYLASLPLRALCLRLPALLARRNTTNLLARFSARLRQGQDLELTNPDRLFNNFLGVDDLGAFLLSVRLRETWDAINLASDKKLTLEEVARLLRAGLDSGSEIIRGPGRAPFFNISTLRAQTCYGFQPPDPTAVIGRWLDAGRAIGPGLPTGHEPGTPDRRPTALDKG